MIPAIGDTFFMDSNDISGLTKRLPGGQWQEWMSEIPELRSSDPAVVKITRVRGLLCLRQDIFVATSVEPCVCVFGA